MIYSWWTETHQRLSSISQSLSQRMSNNGNNIAKPGISPTSESESVETVLSRNRLRLNFEPSFTPPLNNAKSPPAAQQPPPPPQQQPKPQPKPPPPQPPQQQQQQQQQQPSPKVPVVDVKQKIANLPTSSQSKIDAFRSLQASGKLKISPELTFDFTAEDLQDLGEIGRGAYGTVNKMIHVRSSTTLAVKRIRCTVDEREQKKLMMDLEVVMKSNACPYIVQFYGAVFKEGDCWICMELMDASLEQFYKFVYRNLSERIGEDIIGQIALATVRALSYLKDELKIIHRDVKPSNILLDRGGNIKLCDFGISGQLVDSIAQSRDAGCRPYMAPERIDPSSARGYDIRSDVWSLGITLYEISTGTFPYPKWNSIFEQLCQVVQGDPPRLQTNVNGLTFSTDFVDFVNTCLIKDELLRPKYSRLLQLPFLVRSKSEVVDVKSYFSRIFDEMGDNLGKRLEDLSFVDY